MDWIGLDWIGLDWIGLDPLRSLVPLEHLAVLKTKLRNREAFAEEYVTEKKNAIPSKSSEQKVIPIVSFPANHKGRGNIPWLHDNGRGETTSFG